MKRLVCLLCAVLMAMCCIVSAGADVIFEPNDSFYESHREDCVRNERNYTAAGPNGDVTVYQSPESDKVMAVFANGEVVYISYVYTDAATGIQWGYYQNWETDIAGWVPMAYLELIYDGISFEEEFGHLFVQEEGTLSVEHQGKAVKFWKYPGSTEYIEWTVEGENMPAYHTVYTDGDGVRWGCQGYYMGLRGYWINLDAPDADYIPHETEPVEETEAPTEPKNGNDKVEEIVPEGNNMTVVVIAAVTAVVVLTVGLLFVLKRKK